MAKTGKGLPRSLQNVDFSSVVPEATAETAGLVKMPPQLLRPHRPQLTP